MVGTSKCGNEPSVCILCGEFLDLVTSEKGSYSMELVSQLFNFTDIYVKINSVYIKCVVNISVLRHQCICSCLLSHTLFTNTIQYTNLFMVMSV